MPADSGDWTPDGLMGPPDHFGRTADAGRTGPGPGGTRVWIRGQDPAHAGSDTVVLGDLFGSPPPGIGLDRPVPPVPWYRRRWQVLAVAGGLTTIMAAGFLGVPPLMAAMGLGPDPCAQCQPPIPTSAAINPGMVGSPAASSPATRVSPTATATATAPATTPPAAVVPQPSVSAITPSTPPPTVTATYTATASGGGSFTGQVTVANQGSSAITNWQLVVALPGDSISAVQNAEFTDDNDVLFMTPAPYDLSIAPGATATITIYASGSDSTPAECSFNQTACQ